MISPTLYRTLHHSRGFSLLEVLAVLAIMSVLAWAVTPMAGISLQRAQERELKRALWTIRDALDAYRSAVVTGVIEGNASGYPSSLSDLVVGKPNLKRPGETVYFLRRIPADPFAGLGVPGDQTWELRSYASPPDNPLPGDDVFDVRSRSMRLGLNGIPLRDW